MTRTEFAVVAVHWLTKKAVPFIFSFAAITATIAMAIAAGFSKSRTWPMPAPEVPGRSLPNGKSSSKALYFVVGALFAGACTLSFLWEDFTAGDGDIFFAGISKLYRWYSPPIWGGEGRFFPLGHQEFRHLSGINATGEFYHIFAVAQIALACFLASRAFRIGGFFACLFAVLVFTTPGIMTAGIGLIYPERNILFLFSIALFSFSTYTLHGRPWTLWAGIFACLVALFYKEVVFLAVAAWASVFAAACLFPRFFEPNAVGRRNLCLLATTLAVGAAIFVALYLAAVYPLIETPFTEGRQVPLWEAFSRVASQVWFWALLGALCLRCVLLVRGGIGLSPVWEGAAVAATVYVSAIIILRFQHAYYGAPAAFLTWAYCGHIYALLVRSDYRPRLKLGLPVLLAIGGVVQLPDTAATFRERKELVYSKADAARFINSALDILATKGAMGRPIRIYALDAGAWEAGLFGNFLRAKYGLDVVMGIRAEPGRTGTIRCIESYAVQCVIGMDANGADFVVDFLIERGAEDIQEGGSLRAAYVSPDIGFWRNGRHARVFANIERLAGLQP